MAAAERRSMTNFIESLIEARWGTFSMPAEPSGNQSGAFDMKVGDRVHYILSGREGILEEAIQDGDALVTWDDDSQTMVKWNHLIRCQ